MIVLIDSNIIISNYSLRYPAFEEFKRYHSEKKIDVFISKISIDEIFSNHRMDIKSRVSTYNKQVRILSKTTTERIDYLDKKFPEQEHEKYKQYLLKELKQANIRIRKYPKTSHEEIVAYAISKKKPFKNNDSGYKDFLIWSTLKELCAEKKRPTILLTNDNDFLEHDKIHPDLKEDLIKSGINPELVGVCKSINKFNDLYLKDIYEIVDTKKLFSTKRKQDQLFSQIESYLENELLSYNLDFADIKISHQFESPRFSEIERIDNLEVI